MLNNGGGGGDDDDDDDDGESWWSLCWYDTNSAFDADRATWGKTKSEA